MWHEARRQERKIRGMLVDYRKRAERRRDFYEKIKADPTQFLQVHGRHCKIHLDPAIANAAENSAMMPWQGQMDNLIDRFDGRAHLDYIPAIQSYDDDELTQEERQLNYERYRIIAQNSFLAITEERFLKQLHLEEQFGYTEKSTKKDVKTGGVAIGFNYEDGKATTQFAPSEIPVEVKSDDENSDSDLDVDLSVNVSKIDSSQAHEMNKHGRAFGMTENDFYSFLTNDLEEAENYRLAKEEEHEKALFSGRKSRRERRAHREKRLANRVISPPSYAALKSPTYPSFREESKSPSRSPSQENTGKITYITSFGGEEEAAPSSSKPTYADKVKYGKPSNKKRESSSERYVYFGRKRRRSNSRDVPSNNQKVSRSRSRSRNNRSSSRTRSNKRSSSESKSKRTWIGRSKRVSSRSRRSMSYSRKSRSASRRSRSRSRKTRSRSRETRSRSRKSRSKTQDRYSTRSHKRHTSSSSSSSSNRSRSKSSKSSPPRRSKSRSKSQGPAGEPKKESPPKVVSRYYGRRRSDHTSSESEDSDQSGAGNVDVEMKPAYNSESKWELDNNSGATNKKASTNLTVIERLKRKRQLLLSRQFKKDKIAEELKAEREKQEQQTREDELREMAIKLRRRQREKRHAYDSRSSSSSDSEKSTNHSVSTESHKDKRDSQSPFRKNRGRSRDRDSYKNERDKSSRDSNGRRNSRERDRNRRSRSIEWERGRGDRNYSKTDSQRDADRDKIRRSSSPSSRRYSRSSRNSRDNDREYNRDRNARDNREKRRYSDTKESTSSRKLVDY